MSIGSTDPAARPIFVDADAVKIEVWLTPGDVDIIARHLAHESGVLSELAATPSTPVRLCDDFREKSGAYMTLALQLRGREARLEQEARRGAALERVLRRGVPS